MVTDLLSWIAQERDLAFAALMLMGFIEACPGLGLFISGAILLSAASLIYAEGLLSLPEIVSAAVIGAFISDQFGFYLGRYLGAELIDLPWMQKRAGLVEKTQAQLRRFGAFTVVIGRLLTMVRSLVPMLLGASGLSSIKFFLFDVIACGIWGAGLAGLVLGVGSVLGA